jgi:hypothetical protein
MFFAAWISSDASQVVAGLRDSQIFLVEYPGGYAEKAYSLMLLHRGGLDRTIFANGHALIKNIVRNRSHSFRDR